jgi:hypothetical protein
MIQCPKCAAENPPKSRFCNSCGEKLCLVSQASTVAVPEAESPTALLQSLHVGMLVSSRLAAAAIGQRCDFGRTGARVAGWLATATVTVWIMMSWTACSTVDPVVGDWREVEFLGDVNFLAPARPALDATLEIRSDGILIIREGPREDICFQLLLCFCWQLLCLTRIIHEPT